MFRQFFPHPFTQFVNQSPKEVFTLDDIFAKNGDMSCKRNKEFFFSVSSFIRRCEMQDYLSDKHTLFCISSCHIHGVDGATNTKDRDVDGLVLRNERLLVYQDKTRWLWPWCSLLKLGLI